VIAGAITGGDIQITDCVCEHLTSILSKLKETNVVAVEDTPNCLRVRGAKKLLAADIVTEEYPGFATDMQAQFMALMTQARGASTITETIFENRFMHALELLRMGADIVMKGPTAIVRGSSHLSGAPVMATDLRASMSLILAGLVADNATDVSRVYHLDRGYERLDVKLQSIGARLERVPDRNE